MNDSECLSYFEKLGFQVGSPNDHIHTVRGHTEKDALNMSAEYIKDNLGYHVITRASIHQRAGRMFVCSIHARLAE